MYLYSQQKEAIDSIKCFMDSRDSVFILKGYAGTGKTTIIRFLCNMLNEYKRTPLLMAPTGRAAKILGEKTGIKAFTIHKSIYCRLGMKIVQHDKEGNRIQSDSDLEAGIDDIDVYFGVKRISELGKVSNFVIIVDESSMISSRGSSGEMIHFGTDVLIADLLTYAELPLGSKIIFVGDPAQLPPVGDNKSCALDEDYFESLGIGVKSFTLTDVIRQESDSCILANATKIRNLLGTHVRNELNFDIKEGEVETISADDVVRRYTEMYSVPDLNNSVVIGYTNSRAQNYNKAIRKYYFGSESLKKGDILQIVRNNYSVDSVSGSLMNGDFVRIISEPGNIEVHNIPIWTNIDGKRQKIYIELQFQKICFETDSGEIGQSMILTNLLQNNRPALTREEYVALYIDFVMRHPLLRRNDSEFENIMMKDEYFNALQAKYGYAITGHKSQGGEWKTVFVDYTGRTGLDDNSLRWSYTVTTRASKLLFGVNIPNIMPFNKFSIAPIQTVTKIQREVVCVKDSVCPLLPDSALPSCKAKCNSVIEALEDLGCRVLSVSCKPYRDRYTIQTPVSTRDFDCIYNGSGTFTSYMSVQPDEDDALILSALEDERCYEYEYDYTPSMGCLEKLQKAVVSAADELEVKVTGIMEFPSSYSVLYGLKTSAQFAAIRFYYNGKGFVTRAMSFSALGTEDELLQKLITRIEEITCK